jgi:hypothetical protein
MSCRTAKPKAITIIIVVIIIIVIIIITPLMFLAQVREKGGGTLA